jgi:hypothetical protein
MIIHTHFIQNIVQISLVLISIYKKKNIYIYILQSSHDNSKFERGYKFTSRYVLFEIFN